MKNYTTEARERYGNTAAYKEHEQKTKNYTKCITCKNLIKCQMFKEFMDYIGYTTILRHIIPK